LLARCALPLGRRYVDLYANGVGPAGASVLAQALLSNAPLATLKLLGNNVRDEGSLHIARALSQNTTLTELTLAKNSIGVVGTKALNAARVDNDRNGGALRTFDIKGWVKAPQAMLPKYW
jgi:Ran GTPase-activating protein (RanGAP) involved in mRNA processing and transport